MKDWMQEMRERERERERERDEVLYSICLVQYLDSG